MGGDSAGVDVGNYSMTVRKDPKVFTDFDSRKPRPFRGRGGIESAPLSKKNSRFLAGTVQVLV